MPTHSGGLSEPSEWQNPPVPEEWWETIRAQMPCYSKQETRTLGVGVVPETFRSCNEVVRSNHPACSFAAWGKHKNYIISKRTYANSMGKGSPLDKIYELNGKVLLLGASYGSNSSFHLAEYRADYPSKRHKDCYAPVMMNGKRQWLRYSELDFDSEDFAAIGADMEKCLEIKSGFVAASSAKLIDQRGMVDFATAWIARNRT
ncbi:MAG: hypothetical protein ACD_39C01025G0002 [uncultured bacterium]|nr:MAG: hypothetical protein ACD_39C01025G0002 [uncultured bacterium]